MSKKVVVAADGLTATVEDAKIGDIVTTLISTDAAVTGVYGLVQRAGLVVAGMAAQEYRKTGNINPF